MKRSMRPKGPNYTGFKENFYRVKDGRVTIAYLDGSGWFDAFKDTHWAGHFQWCPDDPTIGTYCHEGPWNLVNQRIWLFDLASREVETLLPPGRAGFDRARVLDPGRLHLLR